MHTLYKDESGKVYGYPKDGAVLMTDGEVDAHLNRHIPSDAKSITKLQAVRYFQSNGVWSDIKTAIASDEDVSDRWDATTVLVIDDADVLALASLAESLTGKDVQTMFNEARDL